MMLVLLGEVLSFEFTLSTKVGRGHFSSAVAAKRMAENGKGQIQKFEKESPMNRAMVRRGEEGGEEESKQAGY
jgi:hypothetical protein